MNTLFFPSFFQNLTSRYTALYNDTAVHSLPAVLNLVSNALLAFAQNLTGISASSLMWPPVVQFVEPQLTYNSNSFSAAFVLAVAFVVIPAGFAVEMVADRQVTCINCIKHFSQKSYY